MINHNWSFTSTITYQVDIIMMIYQGFALQSSQIQNLLLCLITGTMIIIYQHEAIQILYNKFQIWCQHLLWSCQWVIVKITVIVNVVSWKIISNLKYGILAPFQVVPVAFLHETHLQARTVSWKPLLDRFEILYYKMYVSYTLECLQAHAIS